MNCHRAKRYLMAYLDSELDSSATVEVNRHLEACPTCRQRFAAEQRLEAAMAGQLGRAAEDEEQVFEKVLGSVMGRGRRGWLWALGALASAALVSAVLLLVPERLPELVSSAALDHEKYRSGAMQPDLVASSAEELWAYLEPRLGISLGELPDLEGWVIRGPRLCHFKKDVSVGLVMLEREGQPVSLFLLSATDADSFGAGWIPAEPASFTLTPGHAVVASAGGTVRCAVGDIPLDELTQLVVLAHQ